MSGLSIDEMKSLLIRDYKKRMPGVSRKSLIRFQNRLNNLSKQELEQLTKG